MISHRKSDGLLPKEWRAISARNFLSSTPLPAIDVPRKIPALAGLVSGSTSARTVRTTRNQKMSTRIQRLKTRENRKYLVLLGFFFGAERLAILGRLELSTCGFGYCFQLNNINHLNSSCCRYVALTDYSQLPVADPFPAKNDRFAKSQASRR